MNLDINKKVNASVGDEASIYESPAILALGGVATLTLGNGGQTIDNCGCCMPYQGIRLF